MSKIGRNDPCFCNSGKKYKKCCLGADIPNQDKLITSVSGDEQYSLINTNYRNGTQSSILATTTGEPFMLIRLYYLIHDKTSFMKNLAKLSCVCFDGHDKFLINYHHEAKNIGLAVKYNEIPANLQPIILAKGKIIGEANMVIDLRSFERGCHIIEFLNQYIHRDAAQITDIAICNKMYKVTKRAMPDVMNIDCDELFSEKNIHYPAADFRQLMQDIDKNNAIPEMHELIINFMGELVDEKPNFVEKYSVDYYEGGIEPIEHILSICQELAYEQFDGQ